MTSSGQGQNDVIMTSPGSGEIRVGSTTRSEFGSDLVKLRVGPGQNSGRQMTSSWRQKTVTGQRRAGWNGRARVRYSPSPLLRVAASSGVVPPINFLVSTSRFQICNNIQLSSDKKCRNWTKNLSEKQTKNVFFFFFFMF